MNAVNQAVGAGDRSAHAEMIHGDLEWLTNEHRPLRTRGDDPALSVWLSGLEKTAPHTRR